MIAFGARMRGAAVWMATVVAVPWTLSFIIYYRVATTYTLGFNEQAFRAQYENSVYRFRILGREAFLLLDRLLAKVRILDLQAPGLQQLDPGFDQRFYLSYFLFNAIFLSATVAMIWHAYGRISERGRPLICSLATALIVLTEFVITPYDTLSYFLLVLYIWIVLAVDHGVTRRLALITVMVLGMLTRESMLQALVFHVAWLSTTREPWARRHAIDIVLSAGAFAAVYGALRIAMPVGVAVFMDYPIAENLARTTGGISLVFGFGLVAVLGAGRVDWRTMVLYCALSFPYFAAAAVGARLIELRLWIPILLPMIFLTPRRQAA